MAKRRWVPIVLGVLILLAFLVVGIVIVAAAWFQQNVQVQTTTLTSADTEFEAVRQKYPGRAPLLELNDGVPRYSSGKPPVASTAAVKLETFNVLAWDPDEEKLARFTLPFWLLRMKSDPIQFSSYASGMDDDGVNIRPEDIEKFGPGIILDTTTRSGDRVLLWTQ
jgi:hypothetical protein